MLFDVSPAAGMYIMAINLATLLLFWLDKRAARRQIWRIPEKALLLAALFGGTPGAKIAQHKLRHKTQKQPFRTLLNLIVVLQLCLLVIAAALPG